MAEYIEREALGIGKCNPEVFEDKGYANGWNAAIDIIQNAPAADVVPVRHGRWKKSYADNEAFGVRPFFRYCSECHEATVHQYTYCPNCGAKMGGDGDA